MVLSKNARLFAAVSGLLILSGCEEFLEGLANAEDSPRFAFVTYEPIPTQAGVNTITLHSAVILDTDQGVIFNQYIPFDDRFIEFTSLQIAPGGQHVALGYDEPFAGMFDSWVEVLDDRLNSEFRASDDIIGSDIRAECDTSGPEFLGSFADTIAEAIANGTSPAGTTGYVDWGNGKIFAGGFAGWLTPDQFVATIVNDPHRFLITPGEDDPLDIGPGLLDTDIYVTYEDQRGGWQVVECSLVRPVIPSRPAPLRDLSLAMAGGLLPSGVILLDVAELLDLNGQRITGQSVAQAVDGPLPD